MKKSLHDMVAKADAAKKVNPRDLSSDQDLTIGIMNMIAIEVIAPDSQIANLVRNMREQLMSRVVVDTNKLDMSYNLLANSISLMSKGMNAFPDNKKAYDYFDAAYEAYAMFWGLNMGFVELADVAK